MTELRQKMIRAMELKNLSPHTQRAYLAAVTGLARHYRQSPVGITKEMIEDYLLLLKQRFSRRFKRHIHIRFCGRGPHLNLSSNSAPFSHERD